MNQWFRDFVHNVLVHPLLPFIPRKMGNKLHDENAKWAFGDTPTLGDQALEELQLIGYKVSADKIYPPTELSDSVCIFFGVRRIDTTDPKDSIR